MALLSRWSAALLLFTACQSAPEWTAKNDPFANQKFPPLTAEQLRANKLPEGYRLGDQGLAVDANGERPWRWSRNPNPETFGLVAHSLGARIDHVQWIYPDKSKVGDELLAAAGIELGEVVAVGRARPRNWGRLTQQHAKHERNLVTLHATNRPQLFVQLRNFDRCVDSIVWSQDSKRLLDYDDNIAVGSARAELARHHAAGAWPEVQNWLDRLGRVPTSGEQDQLAEVRLAYEAYRKATNEPLQAQLQQLAAEHAAAWQGADLNGKVQLYVQNMTRAQELQQQLLRAGSPHPAQIQKLWQETCSAQVAARGKKPRLSAADWFWPYIAKETHTSPATVAMLWAACRTLDSADSDYLDGLAARRQLQKPPVLPATGEADQTARKLLAAQARRMASQARARGQTLWANWLQNVLARELESSAVPDKQVFPYLDEKALQEFANSVAELQQQQGNRERFVALLRRQEAHEGELISGRMRSARRPVPTQVSFLTQLRVQTGTELAREADRAAAQGLPATAAQLALQGLLCQQKGIATSHDLPALAEDAKVQPGTQAAVLRHLLPVLAQVLPPIDRNTAQADRLCELLTEGEAAAWPLVRHFAVAIRPGDIPALREQLQLPASYAHLSRSDDQTGLQLQRQTQPSDPAKDERFWQRYSGWSAETITEGNWIRQESRWIKEQQPEVDTERLELNKLVGSLNSEAKTIDEAIDAHNKSGAKLDRSNGSAVDSYNRKGAELNGRRNALRQRSNALQPRQNAHQQRVRELNQRIGEFNRRLAEWNERRMREGAAGQNALDAMLWPPLLAAIHEQLAEYVAATSERLPAGAARDREIAAARWLFGLPAPAPELWSPPDGAGYAKLMAAACHRQGRRQSTNEAYAQKVAEYCHWATLGKVEDRDAVFRGHAMEFTRFRDPKVLRQALTKEARLDAANRKHWLDILDAVHREVFGKK